MTWSKKEDCDHVANAALGKPLIRTGLNIVFSVLRTEWNIPATITKKIYEIEEIKKEY